MGKAERTKQFIVEKTAHLFNTKGFAGTSLNDITEATGLTKGSVYGNFANKDEVALAVFDYNYSCVLNIIKKEMDTRNTAIEKLLVYIDVYDNFLQNPFPIGGCPILNTAVESDDTHPALKLKAAKAILDWKNNIEHIIKQGKIDKELRQDVSAENVALTIIASIEGSIMLTKLTGKLNYRDAVLESVKKLILSLI
jgi:TetR/AcrR family transcriptional regulator, transcriptional repressor for nem operon